MSMQLSKSEEELMNILWKQKKAFMKDLLDAYPEPKPATTTVATLLKRMTDKEYVMVEPEPMVTVSTPVIMQQAEYSNDTDQAVLKENIDKTTYQNTLLSYLSPDSEKKYQPLANAINYSSIKKRFTVMKTHTSKKAVLLRSLLLLPLLAVLFLSFSETNLIEVEQFSNDHTSRTIRDIVVDIDKYGNLSLNNKKLGLNEIGKEAKLLTSNLSNGERKNFITAHILYNEENLESIEHVQSQLFDQINHVSKQTSKAIGRPNFIPSKYQNKTIEEARAIQKETFAWHQSIWFDIKNENEIWYEDKLIPLEGLADKISNIASNKINAEAQKANVKEVQVSTEEFIMKESDYEDIVGPDEGQVKKKTTKEIVIHINKNGKLLVQDELVPLEDLNNYLSKINSHLTKEQRSQIINSKINIVPKSPENIIDKVYDILYNYGSATIDFRHLKDGKYAILEGNANSKQITELAKKYNAMLEKSRSIQIKMKDVKRLEYIYGLMSKKQKAAAESFPDFPELPPVPDAPKAPSQREGAANIIRGIIEEQDPNDNVHATLYSPVNKKDFTAIQESPSAPRVLKGEKQKISLKKLGMNLKKAASEIEKTVREIDEEVEVDNQDMYGADNVRVYQHNVGESKTASPNLMKSIESLVKRDAQFYFEGKKVSTKEGLRIVKSKKNILIETHPYVNKKPEVRIHTNPNDVSIPKPPSPPEPVSPLDHVIDMAKKNAIFYLEGKEITSDKAIEVMKKNKDINIDSRSANGKRPVVKMKQETNALYDTYITEAEGTAGTLLLGKGPVYEEKRDKHDAALAELQQLKTTNTDKITGIETQIAVLNTEYADVVKNSQPVIDGFDGLMARITALDKLPWLPSFFIFLLFLAIETSPIIAKLLASKGEYEESAIKTWVAQKVQQREQVLATDTALNDKIYGEIKEEEDVYAYKKKKAEELLRLQADAFHDMQVKSL
ncbi:hypothetical protein GQR58_023265 [Nymphon striatum]|nr:hypothetical protein GQR58_023265 [Nymphon striatum]